MIALLIYLISFVDGFISFSCLLGILSGLVLCLSRLSMFFTEDCDYSQDEYKTAKNIFNFLKKPVIFFILVSLFVPNSKTIAAMYLVPKIAENKSISEIPDKLTKLLELKLDGWLSDLDKKEEK